MHVPTILTIKVTMPTDVKYQLQSLLSLCTFTNSKSNYPHQLNAKGTTAYDKNTIPVPFTQAKRYFIWHNGEIMVTVHTVACTTLHGIGPIKYWYQGIKPLAEGDFNGLDAVTVRTLWV